MKRALLTLCLLGFACGGVAAQVSPIPFVVPEYFNNSGQPCSGCLLYTYAAGTTSFQVTYSDALGINANANPVVLDATGRPASGGTRVGIFLSSSAYKFALTSSGGLTYWTIDNVTSSNLTLLSLNNTWTGTNTWQAASTFNGSATFNVGLTSLGPNNLGGGGTLSGTYSGSPIFSGTPNFSAGFLATTGTFSGQITSTVATGTPPLVIASTTLIPNLNASELESATWEAPGTIGSTTPNTGVFTNLTGNTSVTIGAVRISGAATTGQVPTATSSTTATWQTPSSAISISKFTNSSIGSNVTVTTSPTTIDTITVTMPTSGCPCRADVRYSLYLAFTGTNNTAADFWVSDGAAVFAGLQTGQSNANSGARTSASSAGYSTVTYSNSAVVTFTLLGQYTTSSSFTVEAGPQTGSGPNSTMQVAVYTSN